MNNIDDSIHHNDGRKRLGERFEQLSELVKQQTHIQDKISLILEPANKDTINKRIVTSRTLTIEQLSDMLSIDASILESHFWEKFNDNDRVRTRESNLEKFHHNQTLELLKKKDQSWEPIQYKWWSFK